MVQGPAAAPPTAATMAAGACLRRMIGALALVALLAAPAAQAQAPANPRMELDVAPAPGAVLRGLDKVAGAARDLEVSVGDSVVFDRLTITLTDCRYPVGNPAADGFAHLVIHDTRRPEAIFRGWMVASSPALNALDHPRFDIWLIRCTSP